MNTTNEERRPAGLTAAQAAEVERLFWRTFKRNYEASHDQCDAADVAAWVAGDEANTKYDESKDPEYAELNAWFESLVTQATAE